MKLIVPNKENHYGLWNWLAKHPTKDKTEWPGFKTIKDLNIQHIYGNPYCFLCMEFVDCCNCPLGRCGPGSLFVEWAYVFARLSPPDDLAERRRLAILIRDCWR